MQTKGAEERINGNQVHGGVGCSSGVVNGSVYRPLVAVSEYGIAILNNVFGGQLFTSPPLLYTVCLCDNPINSWRHCSITLLSSLPWCLSIFGRGS
jgi:hypothetical protein